MRKTALALALVLVATTVLAGAALACGDSIYDIQTDPGNHPVGTLGVPCDVIVTAVGVDGFYCQQVATAVNPNGEYSGIWVYTGSTPSYAPGDILSVCGLITEVCGVTTLDVVAAGLYGYVLYISSGAPLPPYYVTAAQLAADGEPWESVQITIVDGMEVPAGFDLGGGMWQVLALDGTPLVFDDYWYDFANVAEAQCYNNATGIYADDCDGYKMRPFVDGITVVDCAVPVETLSMSGVKALFR